MTKLCYVFPDPLPFTYFDQNIVFPYQSSSVQHYIVFVLLNDAHHSIIDRGSTYHNQSAAGLLTPDQHLSNSTISAKPCLLLSSTDLILWSEKPPKSQFVT